jgi:hypothetical protein
MSMVNRQTFVFSLNGFASFDASDLHRAQLRPSLPLRTTLHHRRTRPPRCLLYPVLVSAVIAFAVSVAIRRLLALVGAFRIVWHPTLFDVALFTVVWAAVDSFPLPQM